MSLVIDAPAQPVIPIEGGGAFPVRRVWCVGRNYLEHIREMGNDDREPPFFFMKPSDAVTADPDVPYPPGTADLHHEVELLVAIGRGGRDIPARTALEHVWGAGVAVDLTRRDLQAEAKKGGRPWAMGKGFDASAPVGALARVSDPGDLTGGAIWLEVNGTRRQEADLADMIWPVADIIAALSALVDLAPGDVILTGTPAGVGALEIGDRVRCGVGALPELGFAITAR